MWTSAFSFIYSIVWVNLTLNEEIYFISGLKKKKKVISILCKVVKYSVLLIPPTKIPGILILFIHILEKIKLKSGLKY